MDFAFVRALAESTFTVTIVSAVGETLQNKFEVTVAQARASDAAGTEPRRVRFRGGISDFSNSTSPVLRGSLGTAEPPKIVAFVARDEDHADIEYGAFDQLDMRFSVPTDRGLLPVLSGDKRFVDRYFDFACNLGLDYSGGVQPGGQSKGSTWTHARAHMHNMHMHMPHAHAHAHALAVHACACACACACT